MVVSPSRYRAVVGWAAALLALIIFTGAAVRLTNSGLGCEDWPTCNDEQVVPERSFHGWVEFGNRILSGVVAVAVVAAVLTAYRRRPRRGDLIVLAWGLVVGVVAQILLGAVTVKFDLHPVIVSFHFLLSALLMWNVLVLLDRARAGSGPAKPRVSPAIVRHSRIQVGLAALVLIVGTLVTGSGPNSGDIRAERLGFDLQAIARIHSLTAWVFVVLLVLLALRLRKSAAGADLPFKRVQLTVLAAVAQGAIGYWQYARGVPPLLVEFHVMGAVAVWCATIWTHLGMFERPAETLPAETLPADSHTSRAGGRSTGRDRAELSS